MDAAPPPEGAPAGSRDRWYEKAPGTPLDRYPVLGEAMAAAAKAWTESFNALSASHGEVAFKALRATTVADLAHREDGLPIFASLRLASWDGHVGLALGRPLVSAMVESLFGGGDEEDGRTETRPISPVEMRIVDVIGGQAATALTAGFRAFVPTRFDFERTQPKPDPRFLGKPGDPLLAAVFELKAVGRTVAFDVVLPLAALEIAPATWGGAPSTAPVIDELSWNLKFRAEVSRATMALRASIEMDPVTLGAIAAWRVGQVLELPPASGQNVVLACETEALFRCDLGQSAGRYTLRIDERTGVDDPPSRKGL